MLVDATLKTEANGVSASLRCYVLEMLRLCEGQAEGGRSRQGPHNVMDSAWEGSVTDALNRLFKLAGLSGAEGGDVIASHDALGSNAATV